MDPDSYQRIRSHFLRASDLDAEARESFLRTLDEADREEVGRLLARARVDTGALAPEFPRTRALELPLEFGAYTLVEKLGEGGMGVVYAAEDKRLSRRVAIKTLRSVLTDATARERLLREARTAAAINHPNICQVLEVGEHDGELFIAMELLEGESLATRLGRGSLPLGEAVALLVDILAAIGELHQRGIAHRDLKPNNVYLTPHGVKLLDFGLARPFQEMPGERLTQTGVFVGTPGYMAPELFTDRDPGPAADLFAVGALAIEMIAGVPAFRADTAVEGFRSVLEDQPPTLTGGPAVEAVNRVVQRALAKTPAERPASAREMADELRAASILVEGGERPRATNFQRLLVVPFRMLRADEEFDFLPLGLADALNTSLSGLDGLVVLSSHVGARYEGADLDFARIAKETESQLVLTGTLLRSGPRLRVSTQLLELPRGSLVWSNTTNSAVDDVFALQDELAREIVESLAVKLAPGRKWLQSDAPANAAAYQYYLRANQLAHNFGMLDKAQELYESCLEADPHYAPAWARLGRVHRVKAKYGHGDPDAELATADAAFRKALELNPSLSLAHNLYAYHQIEELGESREAMVRLLRLARRRPTDAQLLSGLVVACRFCGLLDASIEAHLRARRLDPAIRTSVQYTYRAAGRWEDCIRNDDEELGWSQYHALPLMGREEEAVAHCLVTERRSLKPVERDLLASDRLAILGEREKCVEATLKVLASSFHDPEGRLFCVRNLVHVGERDLALPELARIVERGYHCDRSLEIDPWFDPVRDDPRFRAAVEAAAAGRRAAEKSYEEEGGQLLLGPGLRP